MKKKFLQATYLILNEPDKVLAKSMEIQEISQKFPGENSSRNNENKSPYSNFVSARKTEKNSHNSIENSKGILVKIKDEDRKKIPPSHNGIFVQILQYLDLRIRFLSDFCVNKLKKKRPKIF